MVYRLPYPLWLVIWLLICGNQVVAQSFQIPKSNTYLFAFEKYAYTNGRMHTSTLPYSIADFPKGKYDSIDSIQGFPKAWDKSLDWFLSRNMLGKANSNSAITVNPILDLGISAGKGGGKTQLFHSFAAGLNLRAQHKNKVFIDLQGAVYQGKYPVYLQNYIQQKQVIPGLGYAFGSSSAAYTYNLNGYLAYKPVSFFTASLGHGKHFIGDGYRSLFLSYNANNYNYLKLDVNFWKIRYWVLYTRMADITGSNGNFSQFSSKYATIHYLDLLVGKHASLGLFEAIVWEGKNKDGSTRGFDIQYLNPFIFFRPVEYSLGSSDNALLGANLRVRFLKRQVFYMQILLDEFFLKEIKAWNGWWANKQGFQVGLKGYDFAGIKGLFYQGEINYVRPYTYTHYQIQQNYAHFGQPLAHPLGANFIEGFGRVAYQKTQHGIEAKMMYAILGADTGSVNYGGDLYKPYTTRPFEYGNKVGQGLRTNLLYFELTYSYLINRRWNLRLELSVAARTSKTVLQRSNELYFGFQLKSGLPFR
ncbi:MAG: hypothetical protein K1X82_10115, partial [Bacteroidia bacterium]|nr:hypothetical protein [Bacteroidia bacterium]